MDFRRSGQRDERRRRVLLEETGVAAEGDELAAAASEPVTESPSSEPARRYSEAALSPRQPRVIDLIPTRRWTNLVLLLSLLSSVAGLEGAYGYLALRQWPTGPLPYGGLDLSTHGSVATWLTAAWLGISAVMGILTYQIRRYRVDDYRGRYRMWYWMVPMLLLGSVDAVAGIQQTVRTALLEIPGIPQYGNTLVVWFTAVAILVGGVGLRLAVEMRACRLAVGCLVLALACWATAGAIELQWLLPGQGVFQTMVTSSLMMTGPLALLMAICLNARHVHRDALGEILPKRARKVVKRKRKVRRTSEVADSGESAEETRTVKRRRHKDKLLRQDPPHAPPESSSSADRSKSSGAASRRSGGKEKRRATATIDRSASQTATCTPDLDQPEESPQLSKAERRRLRKQRRRERA